jgi:hypothetical protein
MIGYESRFWSAHAHPSLYVVVSVFFRRVRDVLLGVV